MPSGGTEISKISEKTARKGGAKPGIVDGVGYQRNPQQDGKKLYCPGEWQQRFHGAVAIALATLIILEAKFFLLGVPINRSDKPGSNFSLGTKELIDK